MSLLKRIVLQTSVLLALYSLLRILFFFLNQQLFIHSSAGDIILACLNGIRYDLAAIALLNLGLFVFFMLPFPPGIASKLRAFFLGILFTFMNGFALSLNVVDLEYFRFTGKRLTADNFLLARDIGDQTGQIALYYWYFSILMIAMTLLLGWISLRVYRRLNSRELRQRGSIPRRIGEGVLVVAIGALCLRGGWQGKPLIPANAFSYNPELGALVLNSTFTILKSSDKAAVVELKDMNWDDVKAIVSADQDRIDAPLPASWPTPKTWLW